MSDNLLKKYLLHIEKTFNISKSNISNNRYQDTQGIQLQLVCSGQKANKLSEHSRFFLLCIHRVRIKPLR